jgi:hypothetical protein
MSIVLVGSSSGSITLQEPAVAGTTTLNLPATSGTVVVTGTTPTLNGITFPATQVPSADANTLDDYEEGTWTPVIADASTGGNTGTFTNAGSTYTKIGNTVTIWSYLSAINTSGMTSGSPFYVRNLPFQPSVNATGSFYTYRVARNASTVSSSSVTSVSTPTMLFQVFTTNSATTDLFITVGNMVSGTSEFFFTTTYKV